MITPHRIVNVGPKTIDDVITEVAKYKYERARARMLDAQGITVRAWDDLRDERRARGSTELQELFTAREDIMRDTLGYALPREMARVRDEVIPIYEATPTGHIAAALMRADLDLAAKAMIEGDVVAMLETYQSLKGWAV